MSKVESLSEDLNLVKEFEELKLKQKLLIDSLNKKNSSQMNNYLLEINSKLDFLVKIFKEVNSSQDENELANLITSKFVELVEKIEEKSKNLEEKIENINEKLDILDNKVNKTENLVEKDLDKNLPPKPEFKIDSKKIDKIEQESLKSNDLNYQKNFLETSQEEIKKKRKWF